MLLASLGMTSQAQHRMHWIPLRSLLHASPHSSIRIAWALWQCHQSRKRELAFGIPTYWVHPSVRQWVDPGTVRRLIERSAVGLAFHLAARVRFVSGF